MSSAINIQITNQRGEDLLVLLTADQCSLVSTWLQVGVWAALPAAGATLTMQSITSGRLYFAPASAAAPAVPPLPNGTDYYGWIEFSSDEGNHAWINLSCVDI